MKARFVFSAFCMLVAMTMATSAFAQGIFVVSSGPEPRGRANGHTELSGGISVTMSAGNFNPERDPQRPFWDGDDRLRRSHHECRGLRRRTYRQQHQREHLWSQRASAGPGADDANRVRISKDKTMLTVHVIAGTTCDDEHIDQRGQRAALPGGIGAFER